MEDDTPPATDPAAAEAAAAPPPDSAQPDSAQPDSAPRSSSASSSRRRRRRTSDATPRSSRRSPSRLSGVARQLENWPLEAVLQGLLALLAGGAVLALGAVHTPVMLAVAAAASIALMVALALRFEHTKAFPLTWPAVILWGLAGVCLLQLIPLPMGVLAAIAPANADVWARALLPLGEAAPAFAPLSLDPGATWVEVLRWFSYGAAFTVAAVLASKRGSRWGIQLVFFVALLAALATLAHGLAGLTKVYGVYTPDFRPQPWHVGPLLNPNSLSGLLNVGVLCGLGLVLSERPELPRWLLGVGVALLVGVNITTASRGGIAVMLIALVALALLLEWNASRHRSQRGSRWTTRAVIGAVAVLGLGLALLGGTTQVWNELLDENVSKLKLVGLMKPVILEYPWLGIGRGAFESVFPAFQPAEGGIIYTHSENFITQWMIGWGVPVGGAALIALAWLLRPTRLGVTRSPLAAGAFVGVAALLLQNLAELGLEIPGLCIVVAIVLGSLWGEVKNQPKPTVREQRIPKERALMWALVSGAIALAIGVAAATQGMHSVAADKRATRDLIKASKRPRSTEVRGWIRSHLHTAMQRHPAEPYFPLMGAVVAYEERDPQVIAWLQRALERSRVNGRAHLLLAQVLIANQATSQALMELRLAAESEPGLVTPAAQVALRVATTLEDLQRVVPQNDDAGRSWAALGLHNHDRSVAAACDRKALEFDPTLTGPHERLARDQIIALKDGKGCQGEAKRACETQMKQHAEALEHASPRRSAGLRLRASWLAATGDPDAAEKLLAEQCDSKEDSVDCLRARVEVASQLKDGERFATAAKALRRAACTDASRCASVSTLIGNMHMQRAEYGSAVAAFNRAVRDDVTDDRLLRLASAASKANLSSQALRALEKVQQRRGGKDPEVAKRIREERDRMVQMMLRR